nr:hypothetical protein [Tanacetum cinerariifolium]
MSFSLAENVIVASTENRPPMLDKTQYKSWASRMLLYFIGKENRKLLVDLVLNGPFKYRTITKAGTATTPATVRDRRYDELTYAEKICEAYDIKATNIVLQGLPQDIYNPVNHHKDSKHIWDKLSYSLKALKSYCKRENRSNVIVASTENRPPMLDKTQYKSWASRMLLYFIGKENRKLLVDLVLNGPFKYRTITKAGTATTPATVRDRRYDELTYAEKICEAYDIKATNIVLQGLPQDIYNPVNHHKDSKHIWDKLSYSLKALKSYCKRENRSCMMS